MLPYELLMTENLSFSSLNEWLLRNKGFYMGELPLEPVRTQWRIWEICQNFDMNICQIQFDEIEITSHRNRIQEGYSAIANLGSFVQFCDR